MAREVVLSDLFTAEQEDFRLLIRSFVEREIVPWYGEWEKAGEVPRSFFRKLGEIGVMGMAIPEKYGGSGDSFRTPTPRSASGGSPGWPRASC